jgi:hypothetical protein
MSRKPKIKKPTPQAGMIVDCDGDEYRVNYRLSGWSVTRIKDGAIYRMTDAQVMKGLKADSI